MTGIRPYTNADAAECCLIVNAAIGEMDGLNEAARDFIRRKNTLEQFGAELSDYYTLVYESQGRLLGVGSLDGHEIKRIYVLPGTQGQGVGRALMQALEAKGQRWGITELQLDASPSAVRFYEQLGYVRGEPGGFSRGEAEFRYVTMRKTLVSRDEAIVRRSPEVENHLTNRQSV